MRTQTSLLPKVPFFAALTLVLLVGFIRSSVAQEASEVVPASYQSGSFFNQKLGTALRFSYHTRGYGTQEDVFSLGGMKIFDLDDAAVYVDGQGTLSDDFGGGFNLGVGYRMLTNSSHPIMQIDPERVLGLGFWTDGQSTAADNFFTQLGFSFESLGESFDTRLNGYFPLERNQTSDAGFASTGTPFFVGNNLFGGTESFTVDTAHTVIDSEFAKRINDLEAWAFVGSYHLGGGGINTTGYRAGVRGYAVPDLALSLQVTDDNLYATNVMFGVTWFIGRTNKCNGPCGTIRDRFREPVWRNDFIAMTSRRGSRAGGDALTDAATNDAIRIVHVDSNVGAGGDGTFENPFDTLTGAEGAQVDNDIILVRAGSVLTDNITLNSGVRLLGEGRDPNVAGDPVAVTHQVDTNENGLINLPEAGSLTGATPTINAVALAETFTMGDGSSVNNFVVNGGTSAVVANGTAAPTSAMLANLDLNNQTGDAVSLDNVTGSLIVDNSVLIEGAGGSAVLVNGGLGGMDINAGIVNTSGAALTVQGRTGGAVTYGGTIDDNGGTGINVLNNTDSTVQLTNASADVTHGIDINTGAGDAITIAGNTGTTVNFSGTVGVEATGAGGGANRGIVITGNDDASNISFADLDATALDGNTVEITDAGTMTFSSADDTRTIANTGAGNAFFNDGVASSAILTVNSNVENTGGGNAVLVLNRSEANTAQFAGTIEATGAAGVFAQNNTDGTLLFTNSLTLNTAANNAVELFSNTGALLSFSELDIDTTDGAGFLASGGGTLLVSSTGTNDINVTGAGVGVNLDGMTIDPGNVTFDSVGVGSGAGVGINLQNLDGTGQVAIGGGTNAGDGGTLTTSGTAINVSNADNVALTNMTISNAGAAQGVNVTGQQAGSTATFTGLDVTTANADAVSLNNNDAGTITFNTLATTTTGTGDGIDIDNSDASTAAISVNDATVNANGTGRGFAATGGGTIAMAGTNAINSSSATAFEATDVENLSASNVTIANTTAQGVNVTGQNTAGDSVTLTNFDVTTTTADAVTVAGNSDGTVILNSLTAESTTGDTVVVQNNTGSTVSINSMTATATDGNAFSATGGGTLIATGTNNATTASGVGVNLVDMTIDAAGATFANVDVTNGATTGVNLDTLTGGAVTVNGGTLRTAGTAVNVSAVDNTALNGVMVDNSTTNGAGIAANNGAGDTLSLSNVEVESGTGAGVDVTGGTFTAIGSNSIQTTTGTGLSISGATIGGSGAGFGTVNVNGATNGVVLANLSGGQVRVGSGTATGTDGAGGTITTTGTAISVVGVENAVFNDVTAVSSGAVDTVSVDHTLAAASSVTFNNLALTATGTGNGVSFVDNGSGEIDFTLRDSSVDVTAANSLGFSLLTGANAGEIDIRLDGTTITAGSNSAVAVDISAGTGDVQFLVSGGNDWTNNSGADATASFLVSTGRTLNASIGDQTGTLPFDENRFANANAAGTAFDMEVNSGAAVISLDLQGNNASGNVNYLLTQTAGTFGVVELVDTVTNDAKNTGAVDIDGGNVIGDFIDLIGPIKQVD